MNIIEISTSEKRIQTSKGNFLLIEQDRGVFGAGKAFELYLLDGIKKEHIREIGWSKYDNHKTHLKETSFLGNGIVNWDCAIEGAKKYLALTYDITE